MASGHASSWTNMHPTNPEHARAAHETLPRTPRVGITPIEVSKCVPPAKQLLLAAWRPGVRNDVTMRVGVPLLSARMMPRIVDLRGALLKATPTNLLDSAYCGA